jgi:NitT/TauT family transport system ATP-binding protein
MTTTGAGKPDYLEFRAVTKTYGEGAQSVDAVSSASFRVAPGEFVSLLGPSGCGKSTILMMTAGLEAITAGQILVEGAAMGGPKRSTGVMFQDPSLLPWKTVIENIMFPIRIFGRERAAYLERAHELVRLVGLTGFEKKRPHELSGGMRQRVAICRALIHDPDLLLMDEPFSALDAITRDEMNLALLDIWEQCAKTALFVTHSIREAILLSDRILVMSRRPATIIADVTVPFGRPRTRDIDQSPEFAHLLGELRDMIEGVRGGRQAA